METLGRDLFYTLRVLFKKPAFMVTVVLIMGLGIGVNTTIFGIINPFLFRPLPVKDSSQLVVLATTDPNVEVPYELSYPDFQDYQDQKMVFSDLSAIIETPQSLTTQGQAERVWIAEVTPNYFSMLGIGASIGRTFLPQESQAMMSNQVLVLSYKFWQRRFAADPSIVGQTVRINLHPMTVIGVAPKGFFGTNSLLAVDAYAPMNQIWPGREAMLHDRSDRSFNVIGRLQTGATLQQAASALKVVAERLEQDYPKTNKSIGVMIVPEIKARPVIAISAIFSLAATIFMALAALVLLITCANVSNLVLSRALSREKEIAIRTALGATRVSIIRQLLTENSFLAVLGAAVGLLLARWVMSLLAAFRPSFDAPIQFDLTFDWRVFVFTFLMAMAAGAISGLMPAWQASRASLQDLLKEGGRTSGHPGRNRARGLLVVSQVAVSTLLLVSAGLFVESMVNARSMDLGFRKDNILLLSMDLRDLGYDQARGLQFYKQVIDRVSALSQVQSASLAKFVPLGYQNDTRDVFPEDRLPNTTDERTSIFYNTVGTRYFETMGIPMLGGRDFTEQDNGSARKVAIINDAMARNLWPGKDPLDQRFKIGEDPDYIRVIGIVRDIKYLFVNEQPRPFFYLPLLQNYKSPITLNIQSAGGLSALAPIREIIRSLDPDLPIYDVKTMSSHILDGNALLFVRLGAVLASAFGILGLVLAVVGIYSVIAYSVGQRRSEIGVRMALGAKTSDILWLVTRDGMILAAAGLLVGLGLTIAVSRVISSLLYGVSPYDPIIFATVMVSVVILALLACYIPARRATRVDPLIALRME
jgi:predicted permease